MIKNQNGNLLMQNLSVNGTFVNGTLVDEKLLVPGDIISVIKSDYGIFTIEW